MPTRLAPIPVAVNVRIDPCTELLIVRLRDGYSQVDHAYEIPFRHARMLVAMIELAIGGDYADLFPDVVLDEPKPARGRGGRGGLPPALT
jgi:hypothetical protein